MLRIKLISFLKGSQATSVVLKAALKNCKAAGRAAASQTLAYCPTTAELGRHACVQAGRATFPKAASMSSLGQGGASAAVCERGGEAGGWGKQLGCGTGRKVLHTHVQGSLVSSTVSPLVAQAWLRQSDCAAPTCAQRLPQDAHVPDLVASNLLTQGRVHSSLHGSMLHVVPSQKAARQRHGGPPPGTHTLCLCASVPELLTSSAQA